MFDFQSRLPGHWHVHRLSVVIEYNYGENRISTKKNTIHIKPRRFYTRSRTIAEKRALVESHIQQIATIVR